MRAFEHKNVSTFEEAAELLKSGRAQVMAGGTDLMNEWKEALLKEHPDTVINLKRIKDAYGIESDGQKVTVRAMTKLADVADSEQVPAALAQAAKSVATPLIRNVGTIGGNICQDVRCWYYRYSNDIGGRFECSRKGGNTCYAIQGENRYHSIFGGMKTHGGACSSQCPAATEIGSYMASIREDKWDEAARILMNVNPMPMLTARICPHPCQDACNQKEYGESVGIHCVERTLGDYILENADKFYTAPETELGKKAAVVGAGPSGLAAAYYMRKAGMDVTVIDAHEKAGGVLMYGIPHYRLPKDIVEKFVAALEGMGIKFVLNTKVGQDLAVEEIVNGYDKVFFGTGAWKQPVLGISGENLTEFGLDFLVEVNTFLKQNIADDVLVCGGGNVAMDVALTAKRMGAKNVTLVCLEQKAEMPASAEEVARAEEEGVIIQNGWGLKKVVTDEAGQVSGLESVKCVSVYDANGRFAPSYEDTETCVYEAKTIILATGQRVDTDFLGETLGARIRTARGLFEVDQESFRTPNVKIYAGGDAVTGPNIAIRAIAAGGRAAKAICREMGVPFVPYEKEAGFLKYDAEGIKETKQVSLKERALGERTLTDEDAMSLSMQEAKKEASRCMNCGCYSVNASDISPVLVAFDGAVITTKKTISARDFFTTRLKAYDMLDQDEIVKAVELPLLTGYETGYIKDRLRPSIDFALMSVAYAYKVKDGVIEDVKLALGGAAPVPVRLYEVEELLKGQKVSAELAAKAGELAVKDTMSMERNAYKVVDAKVMIERLVAAM